MFPLNLYARVRILMHTLHTRPRVQRAPGLPCALYLSEAASREQTSGAMRREIAKSYLKLGPRHCEERSEEAIHLSPR